MIPKTCSLLVVFAFCLPNLTRAMERFHRCVMEHLNKKQKSEPQIEKFQESYTPHSLNLLCTRQIVDNFSVYVPSLNSYERYEDIKYLFISPGLLNLCQTRLNNNNGLKKFKLTHNTALDSQCHFSNDGKFIVSIRPNNHTVDVLDFNSVQRNENFNIIKSLKHDGSVFCFKNNWLFEIDNTNVIKKYYLEKNDANNPKFVLKKQKKLLPFAGSLKKLLCQNQDSFYALVEEEIQDKILVQHLYTIDDKANLKFIVTRSQEVPQIQTIYSLSQPNATHAIINTDGSVSIVNDSFTLTQYFPSCAEIKQEENKRQNPLCSAINPSKTLLSIGYDNGRIISYDLKNKKCISTIYNPGNLIKALCFFDEKYLLALTYNQERLKNLNEIEIGLFNSVNGSQIAKSKQKECRRANTIVVSPAKNHVLLGLGYYDIATQRHDSFRFDTSLLDTKKFYEKPTLIQKLGHKNSDLSLTEKLSLYAEYEKKNPNTLLAMAYNAYLRTQRFNSAL